MNKINSIIKTMGPGLLMAGAAIGVSHLVQSTRAGATFGYQLLLVVLLANLFKYPFFEFGHRYAIATGENLLEGYKKIGKGFLYAFLILNLVTAIGTMAGVGFVTGALAYNLFGETLNVGIWSAIVMLFCGGILAVGHYKFLDQLMKVIMLILFVATISAFVMALSKGSVAPADFSGPSAFTLASLPFLIALMGWMPAPVETSVWTSLWVQAKSRSQQRKMSWKEGQLDFNFGYFSTILLALIFVSLGALVMFGSGIEFSSAGGAFAAQVVDLYTENLGSWAKPIIAFSAFSTMFSTTLTCLDAYPRSLTAATELVFEKLVVKDRRLYYFWLLWAGAGGVAVILFFITSIKVLVDIVTTAAFLTAPIFAFMNYKLIFSEHLPEKFRPSNKIKYLCWLGLTYLVGFSLLFILNAFFI